MKIHVSKTVGAILLVAGTQIGAGMLALPISTGVAGYFPSILVFVFSFLYMLASLFLLLEVNLWSHNVSANIITLAKEHLGYVGQVIAWISFLLLLYSVAAAYLSGGGGLLAEALGSGLGVSLDPSTGVWLFLLLFGLLVVFGTHIIDSFNRILVTGLAASFLFLVIFTVPNVNADGFTSGNPDYIFAAIPVIVLSFTSHIIVPSLRTYLAGDHKGLISALFYGSLIPLVFYIVWQSLIIGVLPGAGEYSLGNIAVQAHPLTHLTHALNEILRFPTVAIVVGFFSFFALVTSFVGVSLALFDFLADGLKVKKTPIGKLVLLVLMYAPPLFFALYYPKGFLLAVSYAGVWVAILYGILPPIMVWKGRYFQNCQSDYTTPGGRVVPIIVFLGAFVIIGMQIAATNGWIPTA